MTSEWSITFHKFAKLNYFHRDFRDKAFKNSEMGQEIKILQKNYHGICKKSFRLCKVRIYEDHAILSVFQHAEGTNFSSKERIACLHLYMIALMAASALYVNINSIFTSKFVC